MDEVQGNAWTGDSTSIASLNKPFWAEILSYDSLTGRFGWREVLPVSTGGGTPSMTYNAKVGGRSGSLVQNPMYVPDGRIIPVGKHVKAVRGYFDNQLDWVYICTYFGPAPCVAQTWYKHTTLCEAGVLNLYEVAVTENIDANGCVVILEGAEMDAAVGAMGCCDCEDLA